MIAQIGGPATNCASGCARAARRSANESLRSSCWPLRHDRSHREDTLHRRTDTEVRERSVSPCAVRPHLISLLLADRARTPAVCVCVRLTLMFPLIRLLVHPPLLPFPHLPLPLPVAWLWWCFTQCRILLFYIGNDALEILQVLLDFVELVAGFFLQECRGVQTLFAKLGEAAGTAVTTDALQLLATTVVQIVGRTGEANNGEATVSQQMKRAITAPPCPLPLRVFPILTE